MTSHSSGPKPPNYRLTVDGAVCGQKHYSITNMETGVKSLETFNYQRALECLARLQNAGMDAKFN